MIHSELMGFQNQICRAKIPHWILLELQELPHDKRSLSKMSSVVVFAIVIVFAYIICIILHCIGIRLLIKAKVKPNSQRLITVNLALAEILQSLMNLYLIVMGIAKLNASLGKMGYTETFVFLVATYIKRCTMLYMTIDRFLDVKLNIKYSIYFTNKKVISILIAIWIIVITGAMISCLVAGFSKSVDLVDTIQATEIYRYLALDIIITLIAVLVYTYLYKLARKVAHSIQQQSANANSIYRTKSKFRVPAMIVFSYALSTLTIFILMKIFIKFCKNNICSKWTTLLSATCILMNFYSDVFIYVFLQRDVRKLWKAIFKHRSRNHGTSSLAT